MLLAFGMHFWSFSSVSLSHQSQVKYILSTIAVSYIDSEVFGDILLIKTSSSLSCETSQHIQYVKMSGFIWDLVAIPNK